MMKKIDLDWWFVSTKLNNGVLAKIFGSRVFKSIDTLYDELIRYDKRLHKIGQQLFNGEFIQLVILQYTKEGTSKIFDICYSIEQIKLKNGETRDMTRI